MQKILVFPFDGIVPAVQNASWCDVLKFMPVMCSKHMQCLWSFSYDSKIFRWQEQGHGCEINLHTAVLVVEGNVWLALTLLADNIQILQKISLICEGLKNGGGMNPSHPLQVWVQRVFSLEVEGEKTLWSDQAFGKHVVICDNLLEH